MSLSNLLHLPELVTQRIVEHIAVEVEEEDWDLVGDEEDMDVWKFVEPVTEDKLELINWLNDITAKICYRLRGAIVIGIHRFDILPDKDEYLKRVKDM